VSESECVCGGLGSGGLAIFRFGGGVVIKFSEWSFGETCGNMG
jgi:hypothetical protein